MVRRPPGVGVVEETRAEAQEVQPRKSTLALGLEVRRGRELRVITYMQSEIFFYSWL